MLSERRSGLAESLWRAGFGLFLFAEFAFRAWPADGPLRPLTTLALPAALALALGWRERAAAALLLPLWWLRPVEPDRWHSEWIVLLLLFTQIALPAAPFGSLSARGRADPAGYWSMTPWVLRLRFATLFAFGVTMLYPGETVEPDALQASGVAHQGSTLVLAGIAAGVVAFFFHERALGWAWLGFLAAAILPSFQPEGGGSREFLWLALAANLQPGWFAPLRAGGVDTVLYDGTCALCHGFVRFVLAEDARGENFRFAPLEPGAQPDSIAVRTPEGATLLRSDAVIRVLRRIGGFERLAAECLQLVPRPLRDFGYDRVAALRKRVFGTKSDACPMLPRHLRARFG